MVFCCIARRAGTIDFRPVLAALVGPVQKHFFPSLYTVSIHLSHCLENWAGSRAGSLVS
jgi:hypothetical protein